MDSYMNTLPKSLNAEHLETIRALFMWLVQPCLCKYWWQHLKPNARNFLHIAIHFCVGLTEEFGVACKQEHPSW